MTDKFKSFIALAKQRYRITLTSVEQKLLKAIVKGEVADYQVKSPELILLKEKLDLELLKEQLKGLEDVENLEDLEDLGLEQLKELEKSEHPEQLKQLLAALAKEKEINNPATAESWGEKRILSAKFIEWLCTDVEAFKYFTNHGLQVCGAKISGKLNLEFVKFEGLLYFTECVFTEKVILRGAKVEEVKFNGSHVVGIDAGLIEVRGSLYLENGFHSKGEVSLSRAIIGGVLSCIKGHFSNKEGGALVAEIIEVKASIFLGDGFKAEGEVSLCGATIGAQLLCNGGHFCNTEKDALIALSIEVKASVFLSDGFKAKGRVSLSEATIGGQLSCRQAHFCNKEGDALNAENIEVKGDVSLSNDFKAEGRVSLSGATIGGILNCFKCHFSNKGKNAFFAQDIEVKSNVFLRNDFKAEGEVSLSGATIGGVLDCGQGHFSNPGKDALFANSIEVKASVFLSDSFKAEGRVILYGANIGGTLSCIKGHFSNPGKDALFANSIEVKVDVLLSNDFKAEGQVNLSGANIGSKLSCYGGHFSNPGKDALIAQNIEVKADAYLIQDFKAEGRVSLSGAIIGGTLYCFKCHFSNPGKDALNIQNIEVKADVYLSNDFKAEGRVSLSGSTIGGKLNCSQGHFSNPGQNALNIQNIEVKTNIILSNGFKSEGKVDLTAANIKGNLDCRNGNFSNEKGTVLSAEGINVEGDILLDKGTFQGNIYLVSARVDDTLSMVKIKQKKVTVPLYLRLLYPFIKNIKNNPITSLLQKEYQRIESHYMKIDLQFARIGRLRDDEQSWPQKNNLNLDGFIYQKLGTDDNIKVLKDAKTRLKWLRLQPEFFPQTYEQLAEVLKKEGDPDAATEILIHKERDIRPKLNRLSKFWNYFLDITIAYGYKPTKALVWSSIFISIGWTSFALGHYNCSDSISNNKCLFSPASEISPYTEEPNNKTIDIDYPEFNLWLYSLDTFIPIVDLHQQTYWLPNSQKGKEIIRVYLPITTDIIVSFKIKTGGLLQLYLWLHIIFGWILTSLWVAGFSGLVRG
ncbi:MAG: hypothetical protein F6K39_19875 [Okeania sp. SIO3B3]|nr:hypothetical protein [Okeania sp. SIO3B3]